jgi:hypothetical protein
MAAIPRMRNITIGTKLDNLMLTIKTIPIPTTKR